MEKEIKKKLVELGIDIKDVDLRFGGDYELFLRLLKKFPEDKNYSWICDCIKAENWEDMLKAVHTFKGVVLGLSLKRLGELTQKQLTLLRDKCYNEAVKMMDEIASEYEAVVVFIEKM